LTRDLGSESLPKEDPGAEAGRLVALVNEHPDHWESRERLATLYADHYGRIPLAVDQIAALVAHPGHPPKRVAGWLNRIADLHLRAPDGAEAARQPLREIISRYPDTVWSEQATLRLATLGRSEKAAEPTKTLRIGMYEQNIGLKRGSASIPNPDPRC
jgi:hypothetical protein